MITLLLPLALAAPPPEGCPDFAQTGLDPGAYTFEYASGDATRADQGEMQARVVEAAKAQLRTRLSANLPPAARAAMERSVDGRALDPVGNGGGKRMVCAVAFVESRYMVRLDADLAAKDRQLGALAAAVSAVIQREDAGRGAPRPLWTEPARSTKACPGGRVGAAVDADLGVALARVDVPRAASRGGAWRLQVELGMENADGLKLIASLYPPGGGASVPLGAAGGFTLNPAVVVPDPEAAFADNHALCTPNERWTTDGSDRREGANGLGVTVRADRPLADLRPGEHFKLDVSTTAEAYVQVYALAPASGKAWLVKPYGVPGGRRVRPGEPWNDTELVADKSDGQWEELLVVAVPTAVGFGKTKDWSSFCAVPEPLDPSDFPEGFAAQILRYRVDGPAAAPVVSTVLECGGARRVPFP